MFCAEIFDYVDIPKIYSLINVVLRLRQISYFTLACRGGGREGREEVSRTERRPGIRRRVRLDYREIDFSFSKKFTKFAKFDFEENSTLRSCLR